MLSRVYPLPDGTRVRMRLVQRRDEQAIRALLALRGTEPEDFEVMRLVRSDPQRRAVICATALIGGTDTLIGLGAIERGRDSEPDLVVVDDRAGEGLQTLLEGALRGRAYTLARGRAA